MPPVTQSWSTADDGVQAPQLVNGYPTEPSASVDEGRKRRRITPIASAPGPWSRQAEPEDTRRSHALDMEVTSAPESWDYLAKWKAEDSTVVEDLEEEEFYSDVSDESPDSTEDAGQELEEGDDLPAETPVTRPSRLGETRVTEIINECIESYTQAWKPGKDETKPKDEKGKGEVPVMYDPVAMWEEAEAAGQREELAEKYDLESEYYQQRLNKLCGEIFSDPGDTVAGVKMVGTFCRVSLKDADLYRNVGTLRSL